MPWQHCHVPLPFVILFSNLSLEREVKRANRDLMQQVSKMDDMQKIDHLTKRSSELLADMRRLEKDNQKNKKRGDTLQKERDANRSELSKTVGLKEKLEKLCRELQRDNNKMKVNLIPLFCCRMAILIPFRTRTRSSRPPRSAILCHGTKNMPRYCPNWRDTKKKRIHLENKLSTWKLTNCTLMKPELLAFANRLI